MARCKIPLRIVNGFILILSCFLTGCIPPSDRNIIFPDRDIVYQANDGETYQLGFVNEDGKDVILFSTHELRVTEPIWSLDKSMIYFRTIVREHPGVENQNRSGYIGMLKNSDTPRAACENILFPTDRLVPTHDNTIVLASEGSVLGLIDLAQCEWRKIIVSSEEGFCSYALSTDETTVLYSERHENKCMIQSMHLETGEINSLGEGRSATYSPDDKKIAFIRPDGIYVMDRNGENMNELIHFRAVLHESRNYYEIPTMPEWSPDGKWLVYHKCITQDGLCETSDDFQIFKLSIANGSEILLIEQGLNPSWR